MSDSTTATTRIESGIEWFEIPGRPGEEDCQCARCGSSCEFLRCFNCGGEGYSHHACGEDTCCCLHPEDNVVCTWCAGTGGALHCISTPALCQADPLPGRESIESTALRAAAWEEAG